MRFGTFVVFAGRDAGGPQTYEQLMPLAIANLDSKHEYHIYCVEAGAVATYQPLPANVQVHVLRPSLRSISIPLTLPLALLRDGIDLLHATLIPPPFCPVDYVFTMHDVTPFVHPEFYPPSIRLRLTSLLRRGLNKAKLILCVSEHVRDTTAEYLGISRDRMTVVHHGLHPRFRQVTLNEARSQMEAAFQLPHDYVLYVGHIEKRKNIVRMLEAFQLFRRSASSQVKLVLAGKRNWDTRYFDEAVARLGLHDVVVELGYVPDALMPSLYSAARVLLFTTLWEGFGFPVIESMACGTPVVASNVSSLPEIAGGAALLADPNSADDIAGALHRLYFDEALRAALRTKGLIRAAEFTWERAAKETLAAYERAMAL